MRKPKPAKSKRVNLHALAVELSKTDGLTGYNADVVDVESALYRLGEKLRKSTSVEAVAIFNAIIAGGKA